MNKNIKNGIIFGLSSFLTIIIGGLAYAAVSNTVTSTDKLTSAMWNEMTNNYHYSLSEINTGKKFYNNKDIFRKCFVIENSDLPSINGTGKEDLFINHGISNFGMLVHFYGALSNGGSIKVLNMVYPKSIGEYSIGLLNITSTQIILSSDEFKWFKDSGFAGYTCLEYTK